MLAVLPKGERRVIIQDGETILLLWYKDEVFAIENRSQAEGAYTEGFLNAKLTQVRMVVDEDLEGFGFTENTELINGRAAIIGFLLFLDFELLTGKGLLKGTGRIQVKEKLFKVKLGGLDWNWIWTCIGSQVKILKLFLEC